MNSKGSLSTDLRDQQVCAALLKAYEIASETLPRLKTLPPGYLAPYFVPVKRSKVAIVFSPALDEQGKREKLSKKSLTPELKNHGVNKFIEVPPSSDESLDGSDEDRIKHVFSCLKEVLEASRLSSKRKADCLDILKRVKQGRAKSSTPPSNSSDFSWTPEAISFLRKNIDLKAFAEIAHWIKGTEQVVRAKVSELKLKRSERMSALERFQNKERKRFESYTRDFGVLPKIKGDKWLNSSEFCSALGLNYEQLLKWEKKSDKKDYAAFRAAGYAEPYPGYRVIAYLPEQAARIVSHFGVNSQARSHGLSLEALAKNLGVKLKALKASTRKLRELGFSAGKSWGTEPGSFTEYFKRPSQKALMQAFSVDSWEVPKGALNAEQAAKQIGKSAKFVASELKEDGFYYERRSGSAAPYYFERRMQRLAKEFGAPAKRSSNQKARKRRPKKKSKR